jgi:1-pyrroline-5-carboxylate dehydrogenase
MKKLKISKQILKSKQINFKVLKQFSINLKEFSKFNSQSKNIKLSNYINGEWKSTAKYEEYPDALNGNKYLQTPLTEKQEMDDIINSMKNCPRSGLHNPFKNIDRYLKYGQICRKVSEALHQEEIFTHFVKLIQRVFPKSDTQAIAEMKVTRAFIENFIGDNVQYINYNY